MEYNRFLRPGDKRAKIVQLQELAKTRQDPGLKYLPPLPELPNELLRNIITHTTNNPDAFVSVSKQLATEVIANYGFMKMEMDEFFTERGREFLETLALKHNIDVVEFFKFCLVKFVIPGKRRPSILGPDALVILVGVTLGERARPEFNACTVRNAVLDALRNRLDKTELYVKAAFTHLYESDDEEEESDEEDEDHQENEKRQHPEWTDSAKRYVENSLEHWKGTLKTMLEGYGQPVAFEHYFGPAVIPICPKFFGLTVSEELTTLDVVSMLTKWMNAWRLPAFFVNPQSSPALFEIFRLALNLDPVTELDVSRFVESELTRSPLFKSDLDKDNVLFDTFLQLSKDSSDNRRQVLNKLHQVKEKLAHPETIPAEIGAEGFTPSDTLFFCRPLYPDWTTKKLVHGERSAVVASILISMPYTGPLASLQKFVLDQLPLWRHIANNPKSAVPVETYMRNSIMSWKFLQFKHFCKQVPSTPAMEARLRLNMDFISVQIPNRESNMAYLVDPYYVQKL